jgi:RNA polymerase sigma-70 factor (ECF subfamily)
LNITKPLYSPFKKLDMLSGFGYFFMNNRTITFEPEIESVSVQTVHIVEQIKAGDKAALEELFKDYYEPLCGFANTFTKDIDDAEDVVQEMFFQFWAKREKLNITGAVKSYLYSAVRNACLNKIKHLKVVREHEHYDAANDSNSIGVDEELEYSELQDRVDAAIDELPAGRRKVYELSRNEGLKYKEIAEQLNISVKTVENQMGKALKHLREALKDLVGVILLLIIIKFLR